MNKMKPAITFLSVFLMSVFLISCNEDEISFSAEADVFSLVKYNQEGTPLFANAFYIYGNKAMEGVVVNTPEGNTIELIPNGGTSSSYYKEPGIDNYSLSQPVAGTYEFEAYIGGENAHLLTDQLENNFIMPVNITQSSLEDNILRVKWEKNENAQAYIFRIINENQGDPSVLLSSGFIDTDSIVANVSTLQFPGKMPVAGEDYSVEIRAYQFESDKEVNLEYNIQAVSSSKETLIWK